MQKRVTYHEAGHAVANVLLGLPFKEVAVESEKKLLLMLGRIMRWDFTVGVVFEEERKMKLRVCFEHGVLDMREGVSFVAGPKAEEMLLGKTDEEWSTGSAADFNGIREVCRVAVTADSQTGKCEMEDGIVAALCSQAEVLLRKNWAAVEAVANELNRRRRLSFKEVVRIVEGKSRDGVKALASDFFKGLLERLNVA